MRTFINYDLLRDLSAKGFTASEPFPWADIHQFLTPFGFQALYESFPGLELFEEHQGIERVYGQKPHNRYYLAYEKSNYHPGDDSGKGVLRHDELPEEWRAFIEEIESSEDYKRFVCRMLGVDEFTTRYAWHVGFTNCAVSPHVDSPAKYGTHIIYFNTMQDWDLAWGGATLVLGGKKTEALNPEFTDFASAVSTRITDNHSFFFKNTSSAWHGVKPLTSPPGSYRRLFNVIFERSEPAVVPVTESTSAARSFSAKGLLGRLRSGAAARLRK